MLSTVKIGHSSITMYISKKKEKERKKNQLLPKTIHSFVRGQYNQGIIKETKRSITTRKEGSQVV